MALLGWDAATLAKHAGVTRMTVSRFINGGPDKSVPKMIDAFSAHGVTFKDGRTAQTIRRAKPTGKDET